MRLFLLFIIFMFSLSVFAQRDIKPFSDVIIGTSGTIFYDDISRDGASEPYHYFEYQWTLSLATELSRFFRVGVDRIGFYSNLDIDQPLALYGGFVQFDFVPNHKNRGYLELNYHHGNFCDCDEQVPYSKPGLNFIGAAIGFDWAFSRYLHLNTGLRAGYADAGLDYKAGFGQYFIGLDLHLFPPKKEHIHNPKKNTRHL